MKFKLYEYKWYDHFHTGGWQSKVSINDKYLVHSVGYLVGEDTDYFHFSEGLVPLTGQYHGVMSVLKSALKSKKLIKVVDL